MEETKSFSSSTDVAATVPQFLRPRHVPDVPEDVDFLMEHLNDPNYDLRAPSTRSSIDTDSFEFGEKKRHPRTSGDYKHSEYAESQADTDRYSQAERSNSRSSAIEFDE